MTLKLGPRELWNGRQNCTWAVSQIPQSRFQRCGRKISLEGDGTTEWEAELVHVKMFLVRFFQGKWYMKAFGNQPVVSDMFLKCRCEVQSPPDVLPGVSCPSLIWVTIMKIIWGPGAEGLMGDFLSVHSPDNMEAALSSSGSQTVQHQVCGSKRLGKHSSTWELLLPHGLDETSRIRNELWYHSSHCFHLQSSPP